MADWMTRNTWFLLLAPGLLLLTAGIIAGVRTARFRKTAARAFGAVVQNHYSTDSEGGGTYKPEVEFAAHDGRKYSFVSQTGSSPASFKVGQRVRILYAAEQPERASIDTFGEQWLLTMILFGVGLIFTLVGSIPLIKSVQTAGYETWFKFSF